MRKPKLKHDEMSERERERCDEISGSQVSEDSDDKAKIKKRISPRNSSLMGALRIYECMDCS
jgi:hypothetical protein